MRKKWTCKRIGLILICQMVVTHVWRIRTFFSFRYAVFSIIDPFQQMQLDIYIYKESVDNTLTQLSPFSMHLDRSSPLLNYRLKEDICHVSFSVSVKQYNCYLYSSLICLWSPIRFKSITRFAYLDSFINSFIFSLFHEKSVPSSIRTSHRQKTFTLRTKHSVVPPSITSRYNFF